MMMWPTPKIQQALMASLSLGMATKRWTHSGVMPTLEIHSDVNPVVTIQKVLRRNGSKSMLRRRRRLRLINNESGRSRAKALSEIKFNSLEPNQSISLLGYREDLLNASDFIGAEEHHDNDGENHCRELERVGPDHSSAAIRTSEGVKRQIRQPAAHLNPPKVV
jgi:hypothetical protein